MPNATGELTEQAEWVLLLSGCDTASVKVYTTPDGSGLAVIGIGLILVAWTRSCYGDPDG